MWVSIVFNIKNAALVSNVACLGFISVSAMMSVLSSSIIYRSSYFFAWVKLSKLDWHSDQGSFWPVLYLLCWRQTFPSPPSLDTITFSTQVTILVV